MTKTVSLNDLTYSEVAVLAGRLSMIAKKPISLGMTISFTTKMFEALLRAPSVEKQVETAFSEMSTTIFTPEEFDSHWDAFFKTITGKKEQ